MKKNKKPKKLKKYERLEKYLEKMVQKKEFSTNDLRRKKLA